MMSKHHIAVAAGILALAIAAVVCCKVIWPRGHRVQRQRFVGGFVERRYAVSDRVAMWELWRESERSPAALLTVIAIRDGQIVAVMPSEQAVGGPMQAFFAVWVDRNGWYRFDKEYPDLSSLLPTFKRAAAARTAPAGVVRPIMFGVEQGAPAERLFDVIREAYPFAQDGIQVMRDVDLQQIPAFGL